MAQKAVQLEEALSLALRLSTTDRLKLVERVVSSVERELDTAPALPTAPEADWQQAIDQLMSAAETAEPEALMEWFNAQQGRKRPTPAEVVAWLDKNPPAEPWGDIRDDEDAGEYVHRMRRATWSTPADALPGDEA